MSLDGPARRSDVEAGAGPAVKSPSSDGETDLMQATARGDVAKARRHLDECRKKGVGGETALMWAAACGCTEVVRVLVEYEGKMEDNQNHNALYYALKNGHMEVAKVILPHEDPTDKKGITALMRAAARGDAEMVELLAPIQKGLKDKDGDTASIHALGNKHEGIASLLIEHESRSLPEKCLMQSSLAEPDRLVPTTSQSPSSC